MKRYSSISIKGKLDKLCGEYYRSRPCDYHTNYRLCKGRNEWCHIKSRKYLSVRWECLNNLTLCSKQHFYFTNHPDEFVKWINEKWPTRLEALQKLFNDKLGSIHDYELGELYTQLKEIYL